MADTSGPQPLPGSLLTREVRWFQRGGLPPPVRAWFTGLPWTHVVERRVDEYDRVAAKEGVGVKRRNGEYIDAKYRLSHVEDVELATGFVGRVEDWVKTDRGERGEELTIVEPVRVVKRIMSVQIDLPPDAVVVSGCDLELVELIVESRHAWSLCFETYGDPDRRQEALEHAVSQVVEFGLPVALNLGAGLSCGYPDWLPAFVF